MHALLVYYSTYGEGNVHMCDCAPIVHTARTAAVYILVIAMQLL
jgi:hypothetical protein